MARVACRYVGGEAFNRGVGVVHVVLVGHVGSRADWVDSLVVVGHVNGMVESQI